MSNIHEVNVTDENLYLELWQYDAGQRLKFVETSIADGSHVLFANSETRKAIRKEVANNEVGIPNKFLRATGKMHITIETFNENEETTLYEINGYIKRRQDGEPGTSPEDEPTFIQKIVQAIKDLQEAVANNFYTKKETDDKDDLTLDTAKNYTDGIAEDLDRDISGLDYRLDDVDNAKPNYYFSDTVKNHPSSDKSLYKNIRKGDFFIDTGYTSNSSSSSRVWVAWRVTENSVSWQPSQRLVVKGETPFEYLSDFQSATGIDYAFLGTIFISTRDGSIYTLKGNSNTLVWDEIATLTKVYTKSEIATILLDYGKSLSVSIDPLTFICTFQLKNGNEVLSTATIDLPLESVVVSGSYDAQTKKIILTLQSGQTVEFSVADLVSGLVSTSDLNTALANYQPKITAQNRLDADLLDDSTSTKKTVTAQEKQTWNGKQDAIGPNNKVSADNISKGQSAQTVPITSSSDNGKFLRVDSSGNLVWQSVANAEDNSY